ncbi:hypothetical protein [Thalassospira sp.]|uniref:hypothetical protein n=1 Tax=Thalassospira sp. TaxID=1912094 RepID=UPI0032EF2F58
MFQDHSTYSHTPIWPSKWGYFAAKVSLCSIKGVIALVCLLVWVMPLSKAQAGLWQCGLDTTGIAKNQQVEGDEALILSGVHVRALAVDEIVVDGSIDQKLRLADIDFPPEYEADVLRELQALSEMPVDIIRLSSAADYLGRIPVEITNLKTGDEAATRSGWAEHLLSKGLAILLPESGQDISSLLRAENDAIENGLGIWAERTAKGAYFVSANDTPQDKNRSSSPPSVNNAIGRFVVVEGTLQSIEHQEWRSYLNFGSDWRRDFTIALDNSTRQVFAGAEISQDHFVEWIGRKIKVRGVVENRGGPYIALRNADWLCIEMD